MKRLGSHAAQLAAAVVLILTAIHQPGWPVGLSYRITGYCPCAICCGKTDGIMADGTYGPGAKERIVAAPSWVPFGTRAWIAGVGVTVVRDRGGAIGRGHLDLFFKYHTDAKRWGVKYRMVILLPGKR
jgi:3D (Asp-Asp-Asp) domain-containing protein